MEALYLDLFISGIFRGGGLQRWTNFISHEGTIIMKHSQFWCSFSLYLSLIFVFFLSFTLLHLTLAFRPIRSLVAISMLYICIFWMAITARYAKLCQQILSPLLFDQNTFFFNLYYFIITFSVDEKLPIQRIEDILGESTWSVRNKETLHLSRPNYFWQVEY